jgi:hypothetical protein
MVVRDRSEGLAQIVVSEVKSEGGEITESDVTNLARVADRFEGSRVRPSILFAKLGSFTTDEIARCRGAQTERDFRIILLSARELEPYLIYLRTGDEFEIQGSAVSLDEMARATDSIFFHPRRKGNG